ncbi:MAG: DUF1761 domain-containing protein [bacterium]
MSFAVFEVNVWAVLVSGVAYFVIGALWYGIFAEPWMKGIGKSRDELQSKPVDYVLSLLAEILIAYGVALGINAFGAMTIPDAVFVAVLLWFAFSLLPAIVHYAYEDRTFSLLAVNKGYDLVGMVAAAVILSIWR